MLQSIRDKTQGWIAGTIISLLILSFALWGIHSYLVGGSDTSMVAKVNGTEITKGQLAVAYDRLRRQLQAQFSPNYGMPQGAEAKLKERALQTLINIQVLKQASIDENYRVSDKQVDGLLENMPDFQVNGQFSMSRFQQILSTTLFNANDFFDLLKTSLLIDQPRLGLIFTSFALPDEVVNEGALVGQERSINYAILSVQTYLNQSISIPKSDIENYYQAHQNEFKTPEQVSVDYIELSVNDLMANLHPSDTELKNFYNENSNSFANPIQWKLEGVLIPLSETATNKEVTDAQNKMSDILQKVGKGESFVDFSQQYPLGKVGQKLQGWVTLDKVPQELQKSVMNLTKPGQMGTPTRIASGWVVFRVIDVKEPQVEPFDQAKNKVKEALVRQQAEEKFANLRDKLANNTYEHPDSLQPAAQALGLTVKSTDTFTKEKGAKDLSSNTKVREAAFSNEVLNLKNNSDVIQLNTDSAIVLRVKSHVPATLLSLPTVEKQITDTLKIKAADLAAQKAINEIKEKLLAGNSLEQVTQQYHLAWNNAGYIGRHATKVDSGILNEAFSMPKPAQDKSVYSTTRVPSGYAVIALNGVRNGSLNRKDEYDLFAEQIQNSQGMLEYELYKNSLMKEAKIVIENPQSNSPDLG
jgi:peptidyl-prolyl cis-trans isomerase D